MMGMKVDEIKKQLDDLGVEYDSKLNKNQLLELLEENTVEDEDITVIPPKKYIVVEDFKDLEDNSFVYFKDDPYPRKGNKDVGEERIQELSSANNKRKKPLIKEQG